MKKFLVFVFVFMILSTALFAEDAKVMPARTGRVYLAPTLIFGSSSFDGNGERVTTPDLFMFNLGAAVEYGINDWITAAIQWVPGFNIMSEYKLPGPPTARFRDMGDIFVGAKMQLMGPNAPLSSNAARIAIAPGVKIPLPGPDFEEQARNAARGNDYTFATIDKHVFGFGLRSYFDIIVNENFFINLYNELILYPIKGDLKDVGLPALDIYQDILEQAGLTELPSGNSLRGEVNYGFDLTFEIEHVFTQTFTDSRIQINAGLPFNLSYSPGLKPTFIGSGPFGTALATGANANALANPNPSSILFTVRPNVSAFFMGMPLPMEFKASYFLPVWGQNTMANHTFSFQVRAYFRI